MGHFIYTYIFLNITISIYYVCKLVKWQWLMINHKFDNRAGNYWLLSHIQCWYCWSNSWWAFMYVEYFYLHYIFDCLWIIHVCEKRLVQCYLIQNSSIHHSLIILCWWYKLRSFSGWKKKTKTIRNITKINNIRMKKKNWSLEHLRREVIR